MSKRLVAAGLCAAVSAFAVFAAHAQPNLKTFTDAQQRFTVQHPADWPVDTLSGSSANVQAVVIGAADAECKVFAATRAESAGKPAEAVRRAYTTPIGATAWKSAADGYNLWSRKGVVGEMTVDTAGFWPVQHATFTTDSGKTGFAVLHGRPGLDVWIFCNSFDNRDRKPVFDAVFGSFVGATDAELQAQAAAAPPPAPPPPEAEKKKRR